MIVAKSQATARFHRLIDDITELYDQARRVQIAFAWKTGQRIVEEEQNGAMRAAYGASLIPKIAEALTEKYGPGFSTRTLANMRNFYRTHPILQAPAKLEWTDYVELMPVKDARIRRQLERRILAENLSTRDLRRIVRKIGAGKRELPKKLTPLKRPADLKLNTFAISKLYAKLPKDMVLVDCGFYANWPVARKALTGLTVTATPSYTYAATVDRVIDGDTLVVLIAAGFGIIMHDKLRLRGIDCPELGLPEGERAKKFVMDLLPAGSGIVLKSHKCETDTHGRFVADVFYRKGTDDPKRIIKDGVYLNQQLLDTGHAVRMAE